MNRISNFTGPNSNRLSRFGSNLPFNENVIMQTCVCRPLWSGTQPEYVISQEDNSPFTLYIDFRAYFNFSWNINSPFDQVHS